MNEKIEIRPGRTVDILSLGSPEVEKTIFMLHGLGGRKEQWQYQYECLKNDFRIIAPDMLGHGQSDKPIPHETNLYSFQELDSDLHMIFERYGSTHNIIAGHSYGGALATSLALSHPDKIKKLILVSPTPLAPDTKIPFLFKLPAQVMEWIRPILERQMAKLIFDPTANPDLVEQEILISRQNPMHVIKAMINGLLSVPVKNISDLRTPATLIIGEHDLLIPPAISLNFYESLPHHHVKVLKNVAHMAIMEAPEKITDEIGR